jgi:hypothetical protein
MRSERLRWEGLMKRIVVLIDGTWNKEGSGADVPSSAATEEKIMYAAIH